MTRHGQPVMPRSSAGVAEEDLSVRLAGRFAAARDPVPGGGSGRRELRSAVRSMAG
jgi:hypothetical protein